MCEPGQLTLALADEAATRAAGAALAAALLAVDPPAVFVTIAGELGAGKTTLVRGLIEALGVAGPVRSPTYTLIETYAAGARRVHHLDWYRLAGPDDLEGVGFRELLGAGDWLVAEWPERAAPVAAQADLAIDLVYAGAGRRLTARALTARGGLIAHRWIQGNA
jgi:tRNA threonylcarbamoyladenosine biosynthesis protein TsaE